MHGGSDIRSTMYAAGSLDRAGGSAGDSGLFHWLSPELQRVMAAIIEDAPPLSAGDHLARVGDPFRDLYAVRDGSVKAYTDDVEGREHVLGFFVPGDLVGFDAIHTGRYRANIAALEVTTVVLVPYDGLGRALEGSPDLLAAVLRRMSRNLARYETLSGDYTAQERLAAFLIMMEVRFTALRGEPGPFALAMSRRDIANYLRLAPETVSRLFTRFAHDGLIRIKGHEITLLDGDGLRNIAGPMAEL